MRKLITMLITHAVAVAFGVALGIYLLPILTAPPSPDAAMLEQNAQNARFTASISEDLRGNDVLHWGKGTLSITENRIVHEGSLAPGPDYKLYLVKEFVEHEDDFEPLKANSQLIGDIRTFSGFILDLPEGVDPSQYTTALIWCEAFGEFIAAAKYR